MFEFKNCDFDENIITSRQNPTIKRICGLEQKKKRQEEGLFRFDGYKLFSEAIDASLEIELAVLCKDASDSAKKAVFDAIESGALSKERLLIVTSEVFQKLSEQKAPEGIITVAKMMTFRHVRLSAAEAQEYTVRADENIIIAESLRDAGNLGTVIRSCSVLGIDRLLLSEDCADIYNPKTVRGAMGGLFKLRIDIIPNEKIPYVISSLRQSGRSVYATALHHDAVSIDELELKRGDCFVIGNEGHGLSSDVIEASSGCAIIPMSENSESLNAAAAAAICIWETVRQKKR